MLYSILLFSAQILGLSSQYFQGDGTAYTLSPPSAGNCNLMYFPSTAVNNYAALNDVQWNNTQNCGRCAMVYCDDNRCADRVTGTMVHIMDRCPECRYGDLDLSPSVFKEVTGSSPSRYRIRWEFVTCPVFGNIHFCLKPGSNPYWTALQPANCPQGIKSIKLENEDSLMVNSAYYYLLNGVDRIQTDLNNVRISVVSLTGETMTDTVALKPGECTEGHFQFHDENQTQPPYASTPSFNLGNSILPVQDTSNQYSIALRSGEKESNPSTNHQMTVFIGYSTLACILIISIIIIARKNRKDATDATLPLDTIKSRVMTRLDTPNRLHHDIAVL